MKHLIMTIALLIAFILVILYQSSVPVLLMVSGSIVGCSFFLSLLYFWKERSFYEEENQHIVDSLRNIRNPISLVMSPLKIAYDQCNSEKFKNELLVVIQNLICLDKYLSDLIGLKHLVIHSNLLEVTEHELGTFIDETLHSLQVYAVCKKVNLHCTKDFDYLSVWMNHAIISFIVDRFIKCAFFVQNRVRMYNL